jgi:anthranilate phosphoribosyltransferase
MNLQQAIGAVIERRDLSEEEMGDVMSQIMGGEATPAQIAGFLVALRMKGESVGEIAAAARVMRSLASGVQVTGEHVVDIVGTGGDGASTFNISTAATFVVAAAGGRVAKHGNRSVSSRSGSADLLEAAGVNLELDPAQVASCIEQAGVGFMFAPRHHSAMKYAIGPRREMGVRTLFNLLGPLTNPAGAPNQLLGVFAAEWVEPLAKVLARMGSRHVMVVHADDGLDEISLSTTTRVAELNGGEISTYTIEPSMFGLSRAPLDSLKVDGAEASLKIVRSVLANEAGPARDIVQLNAGAAIYCADLATSLEQGVALAGERLADGSAAAVLERLVGVSQSFKTVAREESR